MVERQLERITDDNFEAFIRPKMLAVLIATYSWCGHCQAYKRDVIGPMMERFPDVDFGEAVIDFGECGKDSLKLLEEYFCSTKSEPEVLPDTRFFKAGIEVGRLESVLGREPDAGQLTASLNAALSIK